MDLPGNLSFPGSCPAVETRSVYAEADTQALSYKWIRSEEAGYDLGENALRQWVRDHWWGFLRARWIEHLQGKRYWIELDCGDFGLLRDHFRDEPLLDPILDMLKRGGENLDIIRWASVNNHPMDTVMSVLESLNINSHRLRHHFENR